jgi:hypothetical protein
MRTRAVERLRECAGGTGRGSEWTASGSAAVGVEKRAELVKSREEPNVERRTSSFVSLFIPI